MAIGASYAGIRSMTATSGGGFSLMVEAFGLAGISETPLVIIEAQRPGPATGLPTRTAQADLLFVLHASQDEFPRVIFSPGTAKEAFYQTVKAFEIADKYQVPVVVLTDQFLADSYFTEERFDISGIEINRHFLSEREANALEVYNRYQVTETGISPRAIPGAFEFQVAADGHEHDEEGHITEDARIRKAMVEKRFRKMLGIAEEITPPKLMGNPEADLLLVGWGSTYGAMAEAIEILNGDGIALKGMYFNELWPFPTENASKVIHGVNKWAVVENNYTAQLARLIQMEVQKKPDGHILKYTGRPFMPIEIVDAFRTEVMG
jgi:2-oxoglutarate ferredoxin oxidoreductase subunit alpha